MKQRELGELVGFTDGAANRIAQYESGFRVPKEDMVKKIAAALNVAEPRRLARLWGCGAA